MTQCDIGLIGLAVMGQNLALNLESRGLSIAVYNRTVEKTREFIAGPAKGRNLKPAESPAGFVVLLKSPRKIILMVQAGEAVDKVIAELLPLLSPGDLIMDGGNSLYTDTERRAADLAAKNLLFLGTGISGGEEGALKGPSIMAGGSKDGWDLLADSLTAASAKVGPDPCAAYLGKGGAGHLVKMVHNGIEYGYMQIIAEIYDYLSRAGGLSAGEIANAFEEFNRGELASFLVEITAHVLANRDPDTGKPLVEVILDAAGQKGTGRWTTETALKLGVPVPVISAAVEARGLSALRDERLLAAAAIGAREAAAPGAEIPDAADALFLSQIICYAQGLALIREASLVYSYNIDLSTVAKIWRGGCIIRSKLLEDIRRAFAVRPDLVNLLLDPDLGKRAIKSREGLVRVILASARAGTPTPALSAALAYLDGYRSSRLPASLIQAQRDFFGAHTFKRIDKPGVFHHSWKKKF